MAMREEYEVMLSKRADLSYELRGAEDQLERLTEANLSDEDIALYEAFYSEVSNLVPAVHQTFEEMVEFNLALVRNRMNSLSELKGTLEKKIQDIDAHLKALSNDSGGRFSIMASEQLVEYGELMTSLGEVEQRVGASKEAIEALSGFESKIQELRAQVSQLRESFNTEKKSESTSAALGVFNDYFSNYAKRINGEDPILVSEPNAEKFPISIEQLGGTSTGTRKSLISAFDLAMQSYLLNSGRTYPEFVVHDVIESVEGNHLKTIFEIANSIGCQYIVAVLSEKLYSSGLSQDEINNATVLELGNEDLLFEPK